MARTEMKGERKRMTKTKQNTSNSSYLGEEVTPQILSLGTTVWGPVFGHKKHKLVFSYLGITVRT